jgi:hypothetical protein
VPDRPSPNTGTLSVTICMIVCIDNTHRLRPDQVTGDKAWMRRIRDDAASAVLHGVYVGYQKLTCRGHIEEETVENGHHQH